MKEQSFQNLFRDQVELKKSQPTLLDFSRRKIPVRGQFPALTVHKLETAVVTFHITQVEHHFWVLMPYKLLVSRLWAQNYTALLWPNIDTNQVKR